MIPRILNPRYLKRVIARHYTPRWIILLVDLFLASISFFLAWTLRFNFDIPAGQWENVLISFAILFTVRLISFRVGSTYSGIVRYTGIEDGQRIFFTVLSGTVVLAFLNVVWNIASGSVLIPTSVLIIDFVMCLVLLASYRIAFKILFHEVLMPSYNYRKRNKIAIYGAGRSGLITKRSLDQDGENNSQIVAFFDDDSAKEGKYLEGVPIFDSKNLEKVLKDKKIDELIISIQKIAPSEKEKVVERCLELKVKVKVVPAVNKWINGELSSGQIQDVRLEDLMERAQIQLGFNKLKEEVEGKILMVTGASGSIGSELVHQLAALHPEKIVMVDIAESALHELKLELEDKGYECYWDAIIADVRNYASMEAIMERYRPDLVYHAAAYKHVPLMEACPGEAVMTNVYGTKVVSELSYRYGVSKFVLVSTDKAVNPTNVMGASKRIAEILVQSLNNKLMEDGKNSTRFITTRFGNVLGSNGSVIPRFRKQIKKFGPVTVTHPEISRYFMTIPEACQLIIEAGIMGKGGEIYIFDMGESVKIVDLAKKMIRLAGFEPDKDIKIEFSGLRPGEKIQEELLSDEENTVPTHHPKIMIARVRKYSYDLAEHEVTELVEIASDNLDHKKYKLVSKMKEIVPEYKSKNSRYESLDTNREKELST